MPLMVLSLSVDKGWYVTRSSTWVVDNSEVGDAEEPGVVAVAGEIGVYVITTLRLDFHIGRVECVTFQLPLRNDNGGSLNAA